MTERFKNLPKVNHIYDVVRWPTYACEQKKAGKLT